MSRVYGDTMDNGTLAINLKRALEELHLTHLQMSVGAGVSPETLRKALRGGELRPATRQRLELWLDRAAQRTRQRRVPRL
jgi:hypothetical protein